MKSEKQVTADDMGAETEAAPQDDSGQSVATARFEDMVGSQEMPMDISALVADLRDIILDQLKRRPKPWDQMPQDEQQDIATTIQGGVERMVKAVVELVAARGQHTITARLEKFTGKQGEFQATLKIVGGPEFALDLGKLAGKAVLLVDADAAQFYGIDRPADVQKDAPELFDEEEPMGEPVDLEAAAEPNQGEESEA